MKLRTRLVAVGMLGGVLTSTGCDEGGGSRESAAPAPASSMVPAWSDTAEPLWELSVRTNEQPHLADGVVVASIGVADAAGGTSVVAWEASSGNELWRADGTGAFLFAEGEKSKVVFQVPGSVVLADLRTGQELHVDVPDGMTAAEVFRCGDAHLCLSAFQGLEQYRFQLNETSMTWLAAPEGDLRLGDDLVMSGPGTGLSVRFLGDAAQVGWTQSFDDMFGPHSGWERAYGFNWWKWMPDREVLLGVGSLDTGEFVSGGFTHDGSALWNLDGRPCDEIWSSQPVQVICQDAGSDPLRSWMAVDVRTGEHKWRFPEGESGVEVSDDGPRLAKIRDDRYFLVWSNDGPYLVEIATGDAEKLEGTFLCSVHRVLDDGAFLAYSDLLQICDGDTNPVAALWPTRWIQLAGASDGGGYYAIATADRIVVFQY